MVGAAPCGRPGWGMHNTNLLSCYSLASSWELEERRLNLSPPSRIYSVKALFFPGAGDIFLPRLGVTRYESRVTGSHP